MEIKKSKIQGKGVFVEKPIKKGKIVFKFSDNKTYFHSESCDCKRCAMSIRIGSRRALTPKNNSFGWFLNHSCDANCGQKGRNIVALRDIKPREEITIDYSSTVGDKEWKFTCSCKSKRCRKILRSVHYLPKKMFKKFKGFMPKFLEKFFGTERS
jgi:uncharacterized protein